MGGLNKAVAGLVLGVTMVAAATPAEAQRWRGGGRGGWDRGWNGGGGGWGGRGYYGRRGGVSTGAALGIGVLGLGLGAAIASRPRYYDRGYYAPGPGPGYGAGYGYYGGGYGGYYEQECYTRRVWDPYIGRRVRVRTCY